jgi:hypothetical protein
LDLFKQKIEKNKLLKPQCIDLSEKSPKLKRNLSNPNVSDIEMSCVLRTQEAAEGNSRINSVYNEEMKIRDKQF